MLQRLLNSSLLTANFKNTDTHKLAKVRLTSLFLLGSSSVMLLTLIFRIFTDPILSFIIIDICTSLGFFMAYLCLRKCQNLDYVVLFSVFFITFFMLVFIKINHNTSFGLVWSYTVTLFVIPLLGFRRGFVFVSAFYFVIFFFMYLEYESWVGSGWDNLSLTRYIIVSLSLMLLGSFYDLVFEGFQAELFKMSATDELTQIYNRRKINNIIKEQIEVAKRQKNSSLKLAFCIFDVDDFKFINDNYGHLVGDRVLKDIARISKESLRKVDFVGRWGGEEFCIIITNTQMQYILPIIEKMRTNIKNFDFGVNKPITCSFGITIFKNDDYESFVQRADEAMYWAKNNGKDMIKFDDLTGEQSKI